MRSQDIEADGKPYSIPLKLPPFGGLYLADTPRSPVEEARTQRKRKLAIIKEREGERKQLRAQLAGLPLEEERNPKEDMLFYEWDSRLRALEGELEDARRAAEEAQSQLAALEKKRVAKASGKKGGKTKKASPRIKATGKAYLE